MLLKNINIKICGNNMRNHLDHKIDIINDLDNVNTSHSDKESNNNNVDNSFTTTIESLLLKINTVSSELKLMKQEIKNLQKFHNKQIKKQIGKNTNKNKKQTGFMKPQKLPPKLAEYLHLDKNIEMVRNDIIKMLYNKIKTEGLVNKDDKRIFRPDDKLINLFNLDKEHVLNTTDPKDKDGLSFFTLQRHLASLYSKNINPPIEVKDIKKTKKKGKGKKKKKKKEKKNGQNN